MNGLDFLLVFGVCALAFVWVIRRAIERADREYQRDLEYRMRRSRWARELDDIPEEWLAELDAIRRMPETAA